MGCFAREEAGFRLAGRAGGRWGKRAGRTRAISLDLAALFVGEWIWKQVLFSWALLRRVFLGLVVVICEWATGWGEGGMKCWVSVGVKCGVRGGVKGQILENAEYGAWVSVV